MNRYLQFSISVIFATTFSCGDVKNISNKKGDHMNKDAEQEHQFTNALIHESSPYLLQHAHNPVDWQPWNDEVLNRAKEENKLLLISIGYAACHWCHVMEHESFEDTAVARIMNENFICIKVDREERPDVDQVYMNAVQLISGRGGWPLNCFALPDGRPFYGGTYFPKKQWEQLLKGIVDTYKEDPAKVDDYATRLTEGINQSELIELNENEAPFDQSTLKDMVEKWKDSWDNREGGPNRAPKFPIPNNYQFLLRYGVLFKDQEVIDHTELTLRKMAYGGIYDQIGGGFARYSTDIEWKVPHFEKMLYDNAQLVSLYAEAYQFNRNPLYKEIVDQTLQFVQRELMSEEGAFYSSLDADSEGSEGKFYIWTKEELMTLLGEDFELFSSYYKINNDGFWEGAYILMREDIDNKTLMKLGLTEEELRNKMDELDSKLLKAREERVRPGLDDKTLTSWNALMAKAFLDAYEVFGNKKYLSIGEQNLNLLSRKLSNSNGGLFHNYKEGDATINGYLEDYCFTIEAMIKMYQVSFEEQWLQKAKDLAVYCIEHFYDKQSGMFYFTSDEDRALIARKMEVNDNVLPASNSCMARVLFDLGNYFYDASFSEISNQMLKNVEGQLTSYGSGYSNWASLMLNHVFPFYEIAIAGKEASEVVQGFNSFYVPNKMFIGTTSESNLPLLESKYQKGETWLYVCVNKSCKMPVKSVAEAIKQIKG